MAVGDVWTAGADWAANEKPVASTKLNQQVRDNINVLKLGLNGDGSTQAEGTHQHKTGTLAGIPAAGNAGRIYRTTDEGGLVLIDDGTNWVPLGIQILNRDLVDDSVADSADEESIYSHSIPAGIMGATGGVRLTLGGKYKNNSGAARTLQIRVKLGATTLLTSNAYTIVVDAEWRQWKMDVLLMNSATNAQRINAKISISEGGANNFELVDPDLHVVYVGVGYDGTSVEDTTVAKTIDVTAEHSFAHADLAIFCHMAVLEVIPAA